MGVKRILNYSKSTIMKRLLLFFFAISLAFVACQKNDDLTPDDPTDPPVIVKPISASVLGLVIDEGGQAVADAEVTFGNKSAYTDDSGLFHIENATVPSNRAYVKVEKFGYFLGSRTFRPIENETANVRIKMLTRNISESFTAADGGEIDIEGGSLKFPGGAVVDANGSAYNGPVGVAARHLNPVADDLAEIMPGDLLGIDANDQEMGLQSFGMMAVELIGSSGQTLQIASGQEVELTFELPAELLGQAPATIPLWYFDEEKGVWVEEGSAELVGNAYVGKVQHFSFWNCDAPFPLVSLTAAFIWKGENPLSGYLVTLTNTSTGAKSSGFTSTNGTITGGIPLDVELLLEVFNSCNDLLFSTTVGPFNTSTDLGTYNLTPDNSSGNFGTLSGSIESCDGQTVTDGYIRIYNGGNYYPEIILADGDGHFSGIIDICSPANLEVVAVDAENLLESEPVSVAGEEEMDLGVLMTCEELEEYIIYELDGVEYTILENIFSGDSLTTSTTIYGQGTVSTFFGFSFEGVSVGTFDMTWLYLNNSGPAQGATPNVSVTVTEYGNIGEPIKGTFDGDFTDQGGASHDLSGSFKAIREF